MKKCIIIFATAVTVTLSAACSSGVSSDVSKEQSLEANVNEGEKKLTKPRSQLQWILSRLCLKKSCLIRP